MTTVFILFLFIIQLICIYFIALLYTKLSKFDDLEKKQSGLMREMDDSITAYLAELKDENDRLIKELTDKDDRKSQKVHKESPHLAVKSAISSGKLEEKVQLFMPKRSINQALKSYNATSLLTAASSEEMEVDDRTRTYQLYDTGHSIEEIAKKLDKGQTEIELLLKFR